jgi:hypothetical protein
MRTSSIVLAIAAVAILVTASVSPLITSRSDSPCAECHATMFFQYLDILEGNKSEVMPAFIDGTEVLNVTVVLANLCNAGAEGDQHMIHEVSATLSSQNRSFRVVNPTCWIGDMEPGTVNATWQIYAARAGQDTLIIDAQGINTHSLTQFTDSYSPAPTITVNYTKPNIAPTISLGGPAAGKLGGGSTCHLCWTSVDEEKDLSRVSLYYSLDNFTSSNETIVRYLNNTGAYAWAVPTIDSDMVRLKADINDSWGAVGSSLSAFFAIDSSPPDVASVTPAHDTPNITLEMPISVEFTEPVERNSAEQLFSIAPSVFDFAWVWSPDGRTMTSTHTPFEPGTNYTCTMGPSVKDTTLPANANQSAFTWTFAVPPKTYPAPSITLLSPVGGERYRPNDIIVVNWTATDGTAPLRVDVSLTDNNASSPFWAVAGGLPASGGFRFPAPKIVSDACALRLTVYDANGLESSVTCPRTFSIASMPVISAGIGAPLVYSENETVNITWSASAGHGNTTVSARFQTDGSQVGIASGQPLNGSLKWKVPRMNATRGFIALNVTDDWGIAAEWASRNITLRPLTQTPPYQNSPPVVTLAIEELKVIERRSATFNANGTRDPDGDGLNYTWNFGDGSDPVTTTAGSIIHVYLKTGAFSAVLSVTDGKNTTTRTMQVTVEKLSGVAAGDAGNWPQIALPVVFIIVVVVGLAYIAVMRQAPEEHVEDRKAGTGQGAAKKETEGRKPKEEE